MSLLLKNVLITDPHSKHHLTKKSILISNGIIVSFDETRADQVMDLEGKVITPGWMDLNADFSDPGFEFKEDMESGSKTALYGGFTDVHLVSHTNPVIESKSDIEYLKASAHDAVRLHVSGSVSRNQKGLNLTEMLDLHHFGARSFADGDNPIWNAELLLKALQYTTGINTPIFQNARDIHLARETHMHEGIASTRLGLRGEPNLSEVLTVSRDLDILRYSGGKIHFTKISTADGIEIIRAAKEEGLSVTCDVAINHLLFNEEAVEDFDSNYKSIPPFRTEEDRMALVKAVEDGTIDAICSNHRPQDQESKQLEFDLADPGMISLQTFYPSLLQLGLSLEVLIDRITTGPRNVLGLDNIVIEEGSAAKLTIVDPKAQWVLNSASNKSKSTNSPFWNKELTGKVLGTVNLGSINFFEDVEV